jgi:hypothetical protein
VAKHASYLQYCASLSVNSGRIDEAFLILTFFNSIAP